MQLGLVNTFYVTAKASSEIEMIIVKSVSIIKERHWDKKKDSFREKPHYKLPALERILMLYYLLERNVLKCDSRRAKILFYDRSQTSSVVCVVPALDMKDL